MNPDKIFTVCWTGAPGILTIEQASRLSGFTSEHLRILASEKIFCPLGRGLPPNALKLYSLLSLIDFLSDQARMEKARQVLYRRNAFKNASRTGNGASTNSRSMKGAIQNGDVKANRFARINGRRAHSENAGAAVQSKSNADEFLQGQQQGDFEHAP